MDDTIPSLKEAIETWCQKRLNFYRASGEQIRIDANSAEAVSKDHVNRWLFELIQNADDAAAKQVKVRLLTSGNSGTARWGPLPSAYLLALVRQTPA